MCKAIKWQLQHLQAACIWTKSSDNIAVKKQCKIFSVSNISDLKLFIIVLWFVGDKGKSLLAISNNFEFKKEKKMIFPFNNLIYLSLKTLTLGIFEDVLYVRMSSFVFLCSIWWKYMNFLLMFERCALYFCSQEIYFKYILSNFALSIVFLFLSFQLTRLLLQGCSYVLSAR